MIASAIVCQIQKIIEHALKHDAHRLPIRAALRDALMALERPEYREMPKREPGTGGSFSGSGDAA